MTVIRRKWHLSKQNVNIGPQKVCIPSRVMTNMTFFDHLPSQISFTTGRKLKVLFGQKDAKAALTFVR